MKQISILLIIILTVFSCDIFQVKDSLNNDLAPPNSRVDFDSQKSSNSTEWVFCESVEIDLSKYTFIDSIIFIPNLRSQLAEETYIAELYDFSSTDQCSFLKLHL